VKIPVGVANSVSYNLDYDPLDTLNFALQSDFELIQIFINQSQLDKPEILDQFRKKLQDHPALPLLIHAAGNFSKTLFLDTYQDQLFQYLDKFQFKSIIFHYDETESLENILELVEQVSIDRRKIYLENFFQMPGVSDAEKNLRKFLAVFSLANNLETRIYPALDIPRFFKRDVGFSIELALNWCYQILNFFGNKQIPILLHLVDVQSSAQGRSDFCPIGEGIIPYSKIFAFIEKNKVLIEGIVLEYEDKINPLKSRETLYRMLK